MHAQRKTDSHSTAGNWKLGLFAESLDWFCRSEPRATFHSCRYHDPWARNFSFRGKGKYRRETARVPQRRRNRQCTVPAADPEAVLHSAVVFSSRFWSCGGLPVPQRYSRPESGFWAGQKKLCFLSAARPARTNLIRIRWLTSTLSADGVRCSELDFERHPAFADGLSLETCSCLARRMVRS